MILYSILGRSIVIHKKAHNLRWACSTLERGYSPQEAREIRAIASFHHPYGYAYGYIRFTQLIHNDGSKSDTVIEVKLQYPGENDRNIVIFMSLLSLYDLLAKMFLFSDLQSSLEYICESCWRRCNRTTNCY